VSAPLLAGERSFVAGSLWRPGILLLGLAAQLAETDALGDEEEKPATTIASVACSTTENAIASAPAP
jgi:hypothetical protein